MQDWARISASRKSAQLRVAAYAIGRLRTSALGPTKRRKRHFDYHRVLSSRARIPPIFAPRVFPPIVCYYGRLHSPLQFRAFNSCTAFTRTHTSTRTHTPVHSDVRFYCLHFSHFIISLYFSPPDTCEP